MKVRNAIVLVLMLALLWPTAVAQANGTTVLVDNLQPDYEAPGGGGVYSGYFTGPYLSRTITSPGSTAVYGGAEAGIIKAGLVSAEPWDEGLFGFKPSVTIDAFASGVVSYDVNTEAGVNPVWMTIEIDTGVVGDRSDNTTYQHVPTSNPAGWHTVDAAAGLWQKWNNNMGDTSGNPLISLATVAAYHTGQNVVRAYLRLGMGDSYNNGGTGTIAWVDKATLGGVTYDFVLARYWYVDPSGSDSNEGTLVSPFLTIQKAVNSASAGDTIHVAAGTYAGNVTINKSLTLLGDPGDAAAGPGVNAPVIDGGSLPGSAFFLANGVSNVTIQGFEMCNYTSTGNGVGNGVSAWVASTSNITLLDNYFHDLGWNGVLNGNDGAKGDHTNWLIKNNVASNCAYIAFELTNTSNSTIEGNIIHLNNPGIGAIFSSARRNETNLTFKDNYIDGTPSTVFPVIYVYAYDLEVPNVHLDGLVIEGNTIATAAAAPYHVYVCDINTGRVTGVEVHENTLASLKNLTAELIDAENNYWGTVVYSEIVPKISGSVDWSPWCNSDFKVCTYNWPVHNVTRSTDHQTIQAALDAATAGDEIHVDPGLYVEDLKVNKSITLLGPKSTTPRNTGSATDWTSSTTAGWTWTQAVAAGEAVIRSAAVTTDGVVDIAEDMNVTIKGFVIEARNRTDNTNAHLVYVDAKNTTIQTVVIENNIIGPITGDAQDGNKGRFGLAFDSQSGGPNGLAGSVKGNKILGAEGNGANVFVIGQHYKPSMSDYSGMVIESNDVYGSNRSGMELVGGLSRLRVRNNWVAYNGYIWNGTAYVRTSRSAADPNNILFGAGVNLIRSGQISGVAPDAQNAIEDLELSGNTIANNEKTGVYVDAQQRRLMISANSITDNGRHGVWLDEFGTYNESKAYNEAYGYLQDATLTNNVISGSATPYAAIMVTGKPPNLMVSENDLSGNDNGLLQEDGPSQTWDYTVNASANWWGSATPAGVAALVGADVDYTPWLAAGTDTGDPGFQGDFSTLWVDDDSPQTGTTGRIQEGIDLVSGSTVYVAAGTYVEDPVIDKAVTLLGPNADINPNTGTRVDEAVVLPAASAPDEDTCETMVYLDVGDVTIRGFTFDGNNPDLTGGMEINGVDVDACVILASYEGIGNVTIENNIFKRATYSGIEFYNYYNGTAATSNNYIRYNRIEDIGVPDIYFGIGIMITRNFYADVTDNVILRTRTGMQVDYHNKTNPGVTGRVMNNSVSTWRLGLFLNQQWTGLTPFVISGNTFTAESHPAATKWTGVLMSTITGNADVAMSDNDIEVPDALAYPTGYSAGYNVWNVTTSAPIAIEGGSVTGGDYGVFVNNWEGYSASGGNTSVTVDGVVVDGSNIAGVYVKDSPSNTNNATVYANIQNCTIDTDATGILIDGSDASAKANNNKIAGNPTAGVTNNSGNLMDAELNWWGCPCGPGTAGADSVSTQVDYVPWWGDEAMTVQQPAAGGELIIPAGASAAEAQAILNCAAGKTVMFESGSYDGGLVINGDGTTVKVNGCTIGGPAPAFTIAADDVTLQCPGLLDGGGGGGAGLVVNDGVSRLWIRDCEITNWGDDGIQFAGAITDLKLVDNYIHANGGDGIQFAATPAGTADIYGNALRLNGGSGMINNGTTAVDATYNEWGDVAGPAGTNGDGVGANVTYDPWVFGKLYVDPVTQSVGETEQATVYIKMDVHHLYGLQFNVEFDETVLQLAAEPSIGAFKTTGFGRTCLVTDKATANGSGLITFYCNRACDTSSGGTCDAEYDAVADNILTLVFNTPDITGNEVVTPITIVDTSVKMGAKGGERIFVDSAVDGAVKIQGPTALSGSVDLQGRDNDSGAVVTAGPGTLYGHSYGPVTTNSWGNYTVGSMLYDTYQVRIEMARYLDAYATYEVKGGTLVLKKVKLLGGDANDDDIIELSDATIIGGLFGTVPVGDDRKADINNDGTVDILDLTLMGGNYMKTSPVAW